MNKAYIKHTPALSEGAKLIEVAVGERIYFNWGAMHGGDAGTVDRFEYNEFYNRYQAIVKLDSDESEHITDNITGYGIGAYLERLGGQGIFAKKRD